MGVMIALVLANKQTPPSTPNPPIHPSHVASSQEELTDLQRHQAEVKKASGISFSKQGAGLGGSEGIITGWDPDQERVLGGILQTEVSQLSSSLGHLDSPDTGFQPELLHGPLRDD